MRVATAGEGERMVDPSTFGVGMPSFWRPHWVAKDESMNQ